MIKLLFLAAIFASMPAFAGHENNNEKVNQYCATTKNGKLVMTHNDKIMTSNIILVDGTKIKKNGMIIHKDGDTARLKEGECFVNGKILKKSIQPEIREKSTF